MDISIATARPATQQANSVRSLVPMHLREGAENFIGFLEDYYSYINTDGLPSQEIVNIVSEHDIDRTSSQYIDLIQGEIAKNVPNAVAFDKVSLYKKIVEYYLTKGSEDSIINFFKIFYDESITLKYPRERLFKTSSGTWDQENKRYRDTKGFSSNSDVLQDSHFWQDFSYVIESAVPVSEWKNEFLGLVHPAGFKFFGVLVLLLVRRKKWIGRFIKYNSETRAYEYDNLPENYYTPYKTYYTEDLDWMKSLTPPSRSNQSGYGDQDGDHMPMFQYGLLGNHIIQNLCLIANTTDEDFIRLVIRTLHLWAVADCDHYELTRSDYLTNLKFLDSGVIGEYSDTLIKYGDTYPCQDVSKPVIDFLEANVPLGQTPIDYECLIDENGDDLIDENGDCINATFIAGFDAHRELDPQESEALGQTTNEIRVIDKVNHSSIFVTRDGGTLYDNYLNRTTFSNISTFITTERNTCLVGTMTDGGEPSYDSIVTDDGDNLCLYFDYDEHERGLLELHPNAAAAYSLRLLDDVWKDMPVVEVRRASDDTTAGFTATEVSDDTLTNWVNTEMALPLDTASGAAAAYSLRDLSTSYNGNVVDVRRSSDDTEASFTAAEVAGSTMVDWVNAAVPTYEDDFGNNTTGWSQVRGTLTLNDSPDASVAASFAPNTETVNHYIRLTTSNVNTTDTYVTEFDLYIPAGQAFNGVGIKDFIGVDIYSKTLTSGEFGTWISISFESQYAAYGQPSVYATFNGGTTLTGDDTEKLYIRNLEITETAATGYVTKWYDQSGNDNHAVQATPASQPKIVEGGNFLGLVRTDGANDFFDLTTQINFNSNHGLFALFADNGASRFNLLGKKNSYTDGIGWGQANATDKSFTMILSSGQSQKVTFTNADKTQQNLISLLWQPDSLSALAAHNGTQQTAAFVGSSFLADAPLVINSMGILMAAGGQLDLKEIIVYDSDQTDNRKAIESNIGDHYGISGFDQADGYVTTWYDQSGNGNNAIQIDHAKQPKIVESSGTVVADGEGNPTIEFDGVNDYLSLNTNALTNIQDSYTSAVVNRSNSSTGYIAQVSDSPNRVRVLGNVISVGDPIFSRNWDLSNGVNKLVTLSGSSGVYEGFVNTTSAGTLAAIDETGANNTTIGATSSGSDPFDGTISEIIIYDTDQSDDREKIESNINNHYNIF